MRFGFKQVWTAGLLLTGATAAATTPMTMWRGVDRLLVACTDISGAPAVADLLCREVARQAALGSPHPVAMLAAGDQATVRDVVLRVEAQQAPGNGVPALLFSLHADRNDPRSETGQAARGPGGSARVPLDAAGSPRGLDAAVAAQLDRVLPWRNASRPPGGR